MAGLDAGADDFLNKPVDPEELYARVRSLVRMKRLTDDWSPRRRSSSRSGASSRRAIRAPEGHCERLADYATGLGKHLKLGQADLDALYRGGFLHDIGKIAIPDRVLLKKGPLTPEEYELMKRHPSIGDDLCRTVRSFEAVRPIVRHHHERVDGRGYPDGLAGDQIPLLAQIVSVVDVFDALTTDRPYRKALSTSTAYRMLREEAHDGWCPQDLVETFIDLHQTLRLEPASNLLLT